MIVGVGIDVVDVARFEATLERTPGMAERLFTDGERDYAASRARPGQHLAARFCAKEAVAKALGLEVWDHHDIEVTSAGGPPEVSLHGAVAERAEALGVTVRISLTHTRTDAGAVAILAVHG